MDRKRIVSGIRPTGDLHIGHYLGVLKNWVELRRNTNASTSWPTGMP